MVEASDGPTLVVIPWPWEREDWKKALGSGRKAVIHTPDSLARWAVERWEKASGKTLVWVSTEEQIGNDPEEQAAKLLADGKMSAGSAHWLLNEEMPKLIRKRIFPKTRLMALDEPDGWEPEASGWIRAIPSDATIETERTTARNQVTWRPGESPIKSRWAVFEKTHWGAGEWAIETLKRRGGEQWLLVVQTEKQKWRDYLKARGEEIEIRHAAECEGRTWDRILVPSLRKSWGGAILGKKWLDLVASRAKKDCIIRLGTEGPPSWLPAPEENKNYLWWEI